jgi:SH3-like domain-containing protein
MKISDFIRLILLFGLLSGISFTLSDCNHAVENNRQSEIDSIAARFVPDQRIGICSISASDTKEGSLVIRGETTNTEAKNEIIKALNNQGTKLIDSILILPDTLTNEKFMGLVSISVANLRKHPDHKSELVSQSLMGTPVCILKKENSWMLIQTPDRYIAWTESSSVVPVNLKERISWKKSERVIYIKNSGWIYKEASDKSDIVGDLVAGCIMEKSGKSGSYILIKLPDGRGGFVNLNDVQDFNIFRSQSRPETDNVVKTAASLLGISYLWGGTSSRGVDCSGFTKTVYFMNGLILMRDASQQALHGAPVDLAGGFSQLQRGDLLFFGSVQDSKPRVTHVAIYIGNNEYINASGRVMLNSLDSTAADFNSNRLKTLLSARRIVEIENDPGIIPVSKHLWY